MRFQKVGVQMQKFTLESYTKLSALGFHLSKQKLKPLSAGLSKFTETVLNIASIWLCSDIPEK